MRIVLQRVTRGSCTVDGDITGAVELGFVALVGVTHDDTQVDAEQLAKKTAHLRVFADEDGNPSLSEYEENATEQYLVDAAGKLAEMLYGLDNDYEAVQIS